VCLEVFFIYVVDAPPFDLVPPPFGKIHKTHAKIRLQRIFSAKPRSTLETVLGLENVDHHFLRRTHTVSLKGAYFEVPCAHVHGFEEAMRIVGAKERPSKTKVDENPFIRCPLVFDKAKKHIFYHFSYKKWWKV
jgi:hypothetical protein